MQFTVSHLIPLVLLKFTSWQGIWTRSPPQST